MTATAATRNPVNANDPHSIFHNWRVPDRIELLSSGAGSGSGSMNSTTTTTKPIHRDWLLDLLRKYDNPATPQDLKDKALVVAPMVDQSDLPFRLMCRTYGANLCFTPMIHSRLFQENDKYRAKFMTDALPSSDRPLIAQLCGPDPTVIVQTAQAIAPYVDGIDLNCGCPQGIAKRGLYGAFLLEEPDLLLTIVRTLVRSFPNTPISVKVRLLPTGLQDSLDLYEKLVDCGISMLTIHGRTRLMTNYNTGPADWMAIRKAVDLLGHRIPILANGGIASLHDVRQCLDITKADGVMSSEAILEYPPLFCDETLHRGHRTYDGRLALARAYLKLSQQYPPEQGGQGSGLKCVRMHFHKFVHEDLQLYPQFRTICVEAVEMDALEECLTKLEELHTLQHHDASREPLTWYRRHIDRVRPVESHGVKYTELTDDAADCMMGLFGNDDE